MLKGYIAVDDVDAYVMKVRQAGGIVHCPTADIPGTGRFAIVADPQGASFGLFKVTDLDLTDEYRFYVHPSVLGHGASSFAAPPPPLRLAASDRVGDGAIRLTYVSAWSSSWRIGYDKNRRSGKGLEVVFTRRAIFFAQRSAA